MIFIVGGVPHLLFNRFQQLVTRIFGDGHLVIAKPTSPRRDGKFEPSAEQAKEMISDLRSRIMADVGIVENGCAVIVMASPGVAVDEFVSEFRPFTFFKRVDLPIPTIVVGDRGRQTMNELVDRLTKALPYVRSAVRAIKHEVSARRNRTPLLLPVRNFRSDELGREINYLFASLGSAADPRTMIQSACKRIEIKHPFRKIMGASFFDNRNIRFKMPGRALHGVPGWAGNPHKPTCPINGYLRLGAPTAGGFHYDCTRGENALLTEVLSNCHDVAGRCVGNPHLNIYSNDFIR